MKTRSLIFGAMMIGLTGGAASAMPLAPLEGGAGIVRVQLQCTQFSCINPRTGEYTRSRCDYRGCYPISGPVGRIDRFGNDQRYYDDYDRGPPRYRPRYYERY